MFQIKKSVAMFFFLSAFCLTLNAQPKWINGFTNRIAGENIEYVNPLF